MTNIIEIKPYIYDFVRDNLDDIFRQKVYWVGERKIVPKYPYCTLSIIAENKDKRTSVHQGDLIYDIQRQVITTLYKTATVTVSIYNAWVENSYDDVDMNIAMEYTYKQINLLQEAFEAYPINKKFSIQGISPIRPLHETVDGGYLYRYEFDLTIGYNEPFVRLRDFGQSIEVNVENKDGDMEYPFKVTIIDNDKIIIEND